MLAVRKFCTGGEVWWLIPSFAFLGLWCWCGTYVRRMSISPLYPSPAAWLHILFGDSKGGGHLAGQGIDGKTEFPEYWTISRIESAIIMAQFQILHSQSVIGEGAYLEFVDGIYLRLVFTRNQTDDLFLETAHPIRGNGVFRNINGIRVSKPLLRQDRKK